MTSTVLRVAIPRPLFQLYDYAYDGDSAPNTGSRVRVEFGHTEATGIIIELPEKSAQESDALKPVLKLLDASPLLDATSLQLLQWASQYYHHPLGEVIQNALPVALRGARQIPKSRLWRIANPDAQRPTKGPKQQELFDLIQQHPEGIKEEVLKHRYGKSATAIIRQLKSKALICDTSCLPDFLPPQDEAPASQRNIQLTDEQTSCLESIIELSKAKQPKPILLHGITGSGKTEVYLRAIQPLLGLGKQILVLVPEIGLTPQLTARFREFFPEAKIAMLHSKLADIERMHMWLAAKTGQADIVIGTRSAVFVPMPRLGQIIIDEEHDASLKQQEGFRYHARDLAIKRAHDLRIPIIIGSATPAIESLHNAQQGRYHYLQLKRRPGSRQQPILQVQDTRGLPLEAGISPLLIKSIKTHLEAGNQALVFLNRRGFAPALLCAKCGWHGLCPSCDRNMTYHAHSQKLICHHCDREQTAPDQCPDCNNPHISTRGQGTERIEHVLQSHLPDANIVRIDRDTTQRKHALSEKLKAVNAGEPVLLVGTQMLAKGHDFPNLTLVGILDVDQSLFSTDFRAWERLAQLIIQVAGRAGRAEKKGTVILQTSQPDHPFFGSLLNGGYLAIAKQTLTERQHWFFPPFAWQLLIRASAENASKAHAFLGNLKEGIADYANDDCILLGPAPSPIEKRNNRYRFQLLITAKQRKLLHQLARQLIEHSHTLKKSGIRWSMDIDPIDYA